MANGSFEIETGHIRAATPDAKGVRCYKGIPYAAPPIDKLRWRPPQPALPWSGVKSCNAFGFNAPPAPAV